MGGVVVSGLVSGQGAAQATSGGICSAAQATRVVRPRATLSWFFGSCRGPSCPTHSGQRAARGSTTPAPLRTACSTTTAAWSPRRGRCCSCTGGRAVGREGGGGGCRGGGGGVRRGAGVEEREGISQRCRCGFSAEGPSARGGPVLAIGLHNRRSNTKEPGQKPSQRAERDSRLEQVLLLALDHRPGVIQRLHARVQRPHRRQQRRHRRQVAAGEGQR